MANEQGVDIRLLPLLLQIASEKRRRAEAQRNFELKQKQFEALNERFAVGEKNEMLRALMGKRPSTAGSEDVRGALSRLAALKSELGSTQDPDEKAELEDIFRQRGALDLMILEIMSAEDTPAGARAKRALASINPPSPEQRANISGRAKLGLGATKGDVGTGRPEQPGTLSVTAGPMAGRSFAGTPADILSQILTGRGAPATAFGEMAPGPTDMPTKARPAPKKKETKVAGHLAFPAPEGQDPVLEMLTFLFGQSPSDFRAREQFFGPGIVGGP